MLNNSEIKNEKQKNSFKDEHVILLIKLNTFILNKRPFCDKVCLAQSNIL